MTLKNIAYFQKFALQAIMDRASHLGKIKYSIILGKGYIRISWETFFNTITYGGLYGLMYRT